MKSKRNNIVLENNKVIKTFIRGDKAHELMIYKMLAQANVRHAQVLSYNDHQIVLSYISGETLLDIFMRCEQNHDSFVSYLDLWFDYMMDFYKATKTYRHGDVHLSNFIYQDGQVIGLDFEQAIEQELIKDIVDLICYVLFYEPKLTSYKIDTVVSWFAHLPIKKQWDKQTWMDELQEALHRLNLRRKTSYMVDWSFLFKE